MGVLRDFPDCPAFHREGSLTMPQYAMIADHTPDICPASNARTRARALEGTSPENIEKVSKELALSFVLPPMHLDPGHKVIAIIEAPTIETVTQFVMETGLFQWNTVETYPVTPIAEMQARVAELPIVFE
jgi:hypothetical protein